MSGPATDGAAAGLAAPPADGQDGPPEWFHRLVAAATRFPDPIWSRFGPAPGTVPRRSAVLILFGPGPHGTDLLLTQRAHTMRSHAGQVAFPGGRIDPDDDGPAAAALREAAEEAGVDPAGVQVAAVAPAVYLGVTDYMVFPVLAWWHRPGPVAPGHPDEVAVIARVPVAELADPANRFRAMHPSGFTGPGFEAGGLFVWGFTAGLLSRALQLAGLEQPWDDGRVRPVPEPLTGRWTPPAPPPAEDPRRVPSPDPQPDA